MGGRSVAGSRRRAGALCGGGGRRRCDATNGWLFWKLRASLVCLVVIAHKKKDRMETLNETR